MQNEPDSVVLKTMRTSRPTGLGSLVSFCYRRVTKFLQSASHGSGHKNSGPPHAIPLEAAAAAVVWKQRMGSLVTACILAVSRNVHHGLRVVIHIPDNV